MNIGILAIQGGFAAHATLLKRLAVYTTYVRSVKELDAIDALIIPGGESPTLLKFLLDNPLFDAIKSLPNQGKPIFGTCAGAILLATSVAHPKQASLGLIDMTITRNAYGRQLDSHISTGQYYPDQSAIDMVFIRAPRIQQVGINSNIIAECDNEPVCVQQGNCLATTFHPELTDDTRLHEHFLSLVKCENRPNVI